LIVPDGGRAAEKHTRKDRYSMLNLDVNLIAGAIMRSLPGMTQPQALTRAQELLAQTDARLEANVRQWAQGEPVTDDWVGDYCINAIMAIRGNRDFLDALDAMNLYLSDPAAGKLRIWRTRR